MVIVMEDVMKFDIRFTTVTSVGDDLVIGSHRIKDIDNYELNFVFNKYGQPVGLVIAPKGSNYAETENKKDLHNWANGDFTTGGLSQFFDECINKDDEKITTSEKV